MLSVARPHARPRPVDPVLPDAGSATGGSDGRQAGAVVRPPPE